MQVLKCADFNPETFFYKAPRVKNRRGNPGKKARHYIGITTAFDIETSILPGTEQAFMYIWQWCFGETVVIGRTWEEFTDLLTRIRQALPAGYWLAVYVHNLSFEIQYLKGIYPFTPDEIFAIGSRKVVKADMFNVFEFRCSYKLTNMSLGEFTQRMNVEHKKLSGDEFNYTEVRYPWTELTEEQLQYCINDVIGLVEAVNALMDRDGDNLSTIPMTSTGYVRRDVKRAMKAGCHYQEIRGMMPTFEVYQALREAFRGGNCHASRFMAGDIIHEVHSADRSSSYPAVLCNREFPCTEFIPIMPSDLNMGYIKRCIGIRHKALLLRIGIKNLKLRDPYWPMPYLSKDKCREIRKASYVPDVDHTEMVDNGRILEAEYLETTITDLDLDIICSEYQGQILFLQGWYSSYKPLPAAFTDEVKKYYRQKTELKGVEGQEIYYDKAKALLNSLYGMCAMDPVKHRQLFRQVGDYDEDTSIPDEELLEKSNRKAFLGYQIGVWCTAWARMELERGIRIAQNPDKGTYVVYCDTDSVKYIGAVSWDSYNRQCIMDCMESGAMATDPSGVTHYMGVYESEDDPETGYSYADFKTLGAKKYAYTKKPGGETHVTIAGVSKKKGGKELDKSGGLCAFCPGFLFRDAGGTEAVYNDAPNLGPLNIDGHVLEITSNVAILPSTYRLGITGEYERIIDYWKSYLDNPYIV